MGSARPPIFVSYIFDYTFDFFGFGPNFDQFFFDFPVRKENNAIFFFLKLLINFPLVSKIGFGQQIFFLLQLRIKFKKNA